MIKDSFYKKLTILSLVGLALVPVIITSNTLVSLIIAKTAFIRLMITFAWVGVTLYLFKRSSTGEDLNWQFIKTPIFISITAFTTLAGISTILAANPYRSFFGTILRGEGYIHLLFMLAFFVIAALIFKREQWILFFKTSLVSGAVISVDAIWSFIQTGERAIGIFLRNPTFISAYLLFVIFSALIVLTYENRRVWRRFSYIVLGLSSVGLVVSNTRSVILGSLVAFLVVALNLALGAGGVRIRFLGRHLSIRKLAVWFLLFLAIFGTVFVLTLNSPVWERVPGLNRFAELSSQTRTVQSRFAAARISLASVSPTGAGFNRFLFGWGPDNYNFAFNEYYEPEIQRYETGLFDRAHNQVLDMLVMNGPLGLIAYLSVWFFVFKAAFTASLGDGNKNKELLLKSSMLFFGVAYFVHNLAFFDQISTYVPIFVFWGFSSYLLEKDRPDFGYKFIDKYFKWIALSVGILLLIAFYITALVPYRQTGKLTEGLRRQNPTFIVESLDEISSPFNYAQPEIRKRLVLALAEIIDNPEAKPLVDRSWALMEEIISVEPQEPRNIEALAVSYQTYGENNKSPELIGRAEKLLRQELALIPGRQEVLFLLAKSLLAQGKLVEALSVADELLATDTESANANLYYSMVMAPLDWDGTYEIDELMADLFSTDKYAFNVFIEIDSQQISFYRNMHRLYLAYYYEERDAVAFREVLLRAIKMEDTLQLIQAEQIPDANGFLDRPVGSMKGVLQQILNSFDEFGWNGVDF